MAVQDPTAPAQVRNVATLKSATDLNAQVDRLRMSRTRLENKWQLNLNFFQGKQYTYYSSKLNKILSLPTAEGEKPRYRIRLTANVIAKNSFKLLAKMTKTKPMFAATPGSADPSAVKAAQVAESLAEHWWQNLGLSRKYAEALLLAIIMGKGWWYISYDKTYGDPVTFIMQPDPQTGVPSDQPFVNDSLEEMFLDQLEQAGIPADAYTKTIYPGEICVEVLDSRNVFLAGSCKDAEEAPWCVVQRHMDPVDIQARWGKTFEPDAVPDSGTSETIFSTMSQTDKTTKRVFGLYVKPCKSKPDGRLVWWADEDILEDGPLPDCYKGKLPIIGFGALRDPMNPYGMSVVEHAIDDQKEYNRVLSKIVEFLLLTLTPRVWAPMGSVRTRVTNEPGQIIEYAPIGGLKPETEQLPSLPPYVLEHVQEIKARLDDDFFINSILDGTPPPNVESGISIDLLQEGASDAFAPMILDNEVQLSKALAIMLEMARCYYTEPRTIQMIGLNGSGGLEDFYMKDMTPGTRIAVETSSSLPRTRAARIALFTELAEKGVIPMQNLWKYIAIPDMRTYSLKMQADEDQALREHDALIDGKPINIQAMQEAQQQLQQQSQQSGAFPPINPGTGEPMSGEELQEYFQHAGLQPHLFENMETHMDVHGSFMKTTEFEQLPPDAQQRIYDHYQATLERYISLHPLPENVRITHQIRSSIGPTAASQVLTQAGVQGITPEIMMEPPLETIVMDSANDPNDPNAVTAPIVHAAEVAQQQGEMAQQQAQMADQMQQAEQQRQHTQDQHTQNLVHTQQKHDQALQHADEQHKVKVKQMSKPKPSGQNPASKD